MRATTHSVQSGLRVLWLGLGGQLDRLNALQRSVEAAAVRAGWPPEACVFRPHITMGRVRQGAPIPRDGWRMEGSLASFVASDIELVESRLTPRGASYKTLARLRMGP